MSDLPGPDVKPARRSILDRISVVWLVPLAALVISLAIAWQSYTSRGPLIRIEFEDAEGIHVGQTELRYRDVPVGLVEDVGFADGLSSVVVSVRLDQDIARYVDAESEFWVVRPRVTAQGVTGLGTVLSGVYIQGSWDTEAGGPPATHFKGLDTAPIARPDVPGLQIVLSSQTGEGLLQGTPILYRGVQVGAVSGLQLADDGRSVLAEAFVEAPYDELISSSTRFWNASGFSFSLGPQGATLDVSSLAALVSGGVSLDNLVSGGEQAETGTVFQLYDSRADALSSVFADPDAGDRVSVGFVFSGDVSGLTVGSAVEYQGFRVGEVTGVAGVIDEERYGDRRVRLLASAELEPSRLAIRDADADTTDGSFADATMAALVGLAESGVRARLARGSLLVGGLKVVLAEEPDAAPAAFDLGAEPFPIFPSTSAEIPDAADTVEGLIARVNDLPIESVLGGVSTLLENVNVILGSNATRAAPEELVGLVTDVRALVGSDAIQRVPGEVSEILADLEGAVGDVRDILAEFKDAGAATALTDALTQAAPAIETIDRLLTSAEPAFTRLPALVGQLEGAATDIASLSRTAAGLPLTELVDSAAQTAEAARELIASDEVRQVPSEISEVLGGISRTLEDVQTTGLVARTSTAAESAGAAADRLTEAAAELPQLIARIEGVAARIEALPLEPTLQAAERTLSSAGDILASEAAQGLPQELDASIGELRAAVAEIRSSGIVGRANETLASAGETANAIRDATAGVPDLVATINDLAATANALPLQRLATDLTTAVQSAQRALVSVDELLGSESVRGLPSELNVTLAALRAVVADVRLTEVVARLEDTLAEAGRAAESVREATVGVPAVVTGIDELTRKANALPLERLTEEVTDLAATAETLLATEGAQQLPASLSAALEEVRVALEELREGGLISSANQTLASARDAAAAIEQASESLPQLAARLDRLADQAERTLAGYDEGSQLTREAQATLREVQAAARSVSALARQIERNPNSLLLGR